MYDSGRNLWGPELCARRPDVTREIVEEYLHNLYRVQPDFHVQRIAGLRSLVPDTDAGHA